MIRGIEEHAATLKSRRPQCPPPPPHHSSSSLASKACGSDGTQRRWQSGEFSDWTIVVGRRAFHVHRFVLGVGPRSSSMLYRLFQNDKFLDHHDRTTHIALEHTCASHDVDELAHHFEVAFDKLLAFVYDNHLDPEFDLNTAMALWRLADYLCLHELLERLRLFVRNNAKVPLLDALLSAAKRFGVAMVPDIVASKCARHLGAVPSSVWQRQDPSFLTRVLSCARLVGPRSMASDILAQYLRQRADVRRDAAAVSRLLHALHAHPRQQISDNDAAFFLVVADTANRRSANEELIASLIAQVAANFGSYPRSQLKRLSPQSFTRVLLHERLCCSCSHKLQDDVLHIFEHHLRHLNEQSIRALLALDVLQESTKQRMCLLLATAAAGPTTTTTTSNESSKQCISVASSRLPQQQRLHEDATTRALVNTLKAKHKSLDSDLQLMTPSELCNLALQLCRSNDGMSALHRFAAACVRAFECSESRARLSLTVPPSSVELAQMYDGHGLHLGCWLWIATLDESCEVCHRAQPNVLALQSPFSMELFPALLAPGSNRATSDRVSLQLLLSSDAVPTIAAIDGGGSSNSTVNIVRQCFSCATVEALGEKSSDTTYYMQI